MNIEKPQDHFPDRRQALRELALASALGALLTHEVLWPDRVALAADPKAPAGDWGTVKGRVVWDDAEKPPERREVDFEKLKLLSDDLKFFTSKGKVYYEDWVIDPKSKALQHVFVWLRPDSTARDPEPLQVHADLKEVKATEVVMDQEPMGYRPHALALRAGQTLVVKNTSPIFHSLAWSSENNGDGNRAMPKGSEVRFEKLKAERIPVPFSCAPHPWEKAYLRVFDHPYFALTGPDGRFEIKLAPAGKVRLAVWQETLGFKGGTAGRFGQPITVEAGATLDLGDLKVKSA
ncbi:hypothetical protein GobsT_16080 [Gemmata obscuriglobus]|uniref:Uncharacterized protein n=1 Tax=Gemmata obscuriglobus TaxID=114 RepID=A0A2Z3H531_9BACT|nr:carboxypeptidase regulatory-like domain-containing protein [Gemmata obscuriglobus]AWM39991.1 hypothetical protein C1280_25285 [Gemmata obscuriglobus]QEG26860.1 hypothetical protein GobsT_16080 [Gemmata obscuriglobus]VTS02871.1 Uncharacterized protein OS=Singulisphaera acidiphila (strain ATCC BAA-1392 / DSM 18658 / VKM B-2454 / MOB10) GN=Sinac_1834 PE=4 SV=1 [Gemmata obscuriglobus UQM 2246]